MAEMERAPGFTGDGGRAEEPSGWKWALYVQVWRTDPLGNFKAMIGPDAGFGDQQPIHDAITNAQRSRTV